MDINNPTPPSVAFILAGSLIYYGLTMNIPLMIGAGGVFLIVGVFLQVLYIRTRYRRNGNHIRSPN